MPGKVIFYPVIYDLFSSTYNRGVKLIYLPPYSPDLNPIEESFSFMKKYIQRHGARFRAEIATKQPERPYPFLNEALSQVTPELAKAWFRHAGYI